MFIGDKEHFLVFYHVNEGKLVLDHIAGYDEQADVFDIVQESKHFTEEVIPASGWDATGTTWYMVQMDRANVLPIFFPNGVPANVS